MKNSDKPAFPIINNDGFATSFEYVNSKNENCGAIGLTKREYFAAMAMQGLVNREGWAERFVSEGGDNSLMNMLAFASVKMADELLKQLES